MKRPEKKEIDYTDPVDINRQKQFYNQACDDWEKWLLSKKDLLSVGWHKCEIDFGINGSIVNLTLEELKKFREMIIVAIWCAEDMWRRNEKKILGEG